MNDYRLLYNIRIKEIVLDRYGKACVCCGETEKVFLTIDHIHNNGAEHRRELSNKGGYAFYLWLIRQDLPEGYQTLCFNCNAAKYILGKCPHRAN